MWGWRRRFCPPGVENADKTDLRVQPFGVGRNFEHRGGTGVEKQVIQYPGVALAEWL